MVNWVDFAKKSLEFDILISISSDVAFDNAFGQFEYNAKWLLVKACLSINV
jgi:hypothetical protein